MEKVKIMVVEDESIVVMEIRDRLSSMGYIVSSTASSGEEAVERAGATQPNLILMDIMLNGDMDGVEAAKQIRQLHKIPVIYLTALADEDTMHRAEETSPYGYLIKPLEEEELRSTIEKALVRYRSESIRKG